MEQPANDGRYILSEIEVMGKGGLLAQPAAAPAATKERRSVYRAETGKYNELPR